MGQVRRKVVELMEATIVVYFTSLRVVRSTFEDCKAVRSILCAFRVPIDERDLSMDARFTVELVRILGLSEWSKLKLPRVFIGGRYVGGAEEVRCFHENGELKKYVERLPRAELGTCDTCGGYGVGFILCIECDGSRKLYSEKASFKSCGSVRGGRRRRRRKRTVVDLFAAEEEVDGGGSHCDDFCPIEFL